MEKILQLAIGWLESCEQIVFGDYVIENDYKATTIKKWNEIIWVVVDWKIYINGLWTKSRFEVALQNNMDLLINLVEKRIKRTESKKSDYYWENDKLKHKIEELEAKLSKKVVEETQENLSDKDSKAWKK